MGAETQNRLAYSIQLFYLVQYKKAQLIMGKLVSEFSGLQVCNILS